MICLRRFGLVERKIAWSFIAKAFRFIGAKNAQALTTSGERIVVAAGKVACDEIRKYRSTAGKIRNFGHHAVN